MFDRHEKYYGTLRGPVPQKKNPFNLENTEPWRKKRKKKNMRANPEEINRKITASRGN